MGLKMKVLLVNALLILAGVLGLELWFGTWFSDIPALYNFTKPRDVRIVFEGRMAGQSEDVVYTRDGFGFRGLDGPLDRIFMLTVGGSTTDQRFITDGQTFQDLLEAHFRRDGRTVDVVNAGIDGQSTFGHLLNFEEWFDKLPHLEPRYILFYIGINDFFDFSRRQGYDRVAKRTGSPLIRFAKDRSAFYAAYRIGRSFLFPPPVAHRFDIDASYFGPGSDYTTERAVADYRTAAVEDSLSQLGERVAELADRSRRIGARAIFVTQRSRLWHRIDGQLVGVPEWRPDEFSPALKDFPAMTGVDRYHLERLQAEAILDACRKAGAICIDLADEIEVDPDRDFHDNVHTTPSGSRKIADYLYQKLKGLE